MLRLFSIFFCFITLIKNRNPFGNYRIILFIFSTLNKCYWIPPMECRFKVSYFICNIVYTFAINVWSVFFRTASDNRLISFFVLIQKLNAISIHLVDRKQLLQYRYNIFVCNFLLVCEQFISSYLHFYTSQS